MLPLPRLASRVDPSPASDADLAQLTGVNLFVIGSDDEVTELFTPLWPSLATPIFVRYRGEPLQLPPSTEVRTIVVYDLDTLTLQEQHALSQWLGEGCGRAWVVSTASESVLPLVEAGLFNDGLYYRLNVVTIDLT